MKINEEGLNLIKHFEGCKLKAYKDTGGVLTIGYGHTKRVHPNQVITQEEAEDILLEDLLWAEEAVDNLVRVPLTSNEFSALVSFVFNVGAKAFKNSTMLKLLNENMSKEKVATQFTRWVFDNGKFLKGLATRREAEKDLFLKP